MKTLLSMVQFDTVSDVYVRQQPLDEQNRCTPCDPKRLKMNKEAQEEEKKHKKKKTATHIN